LSRARELRSGVKERRPHKGGGHGWGSPEREKSGARAGRDRVKKGIKHPKMGVIDKGGTLYQRGLGETRKRGGMNL